jgi:oligopeptidase B
VAVDIEDEDGMRIRAFGFPHGREIPVPRPAEIGVASSSFPNDNEANLQPASTVLRFRFSGPLQPECIYDFDVSNGSLSLRKQDRAISWFNRDQYMVDRRYAMASDGETVPITIVVCRLLQPPRLRRRELRNRDLKKKEASASLKWRRTVKKRRYRD